MRLFVIILFHELASLYAFLQIDHLVLLVAPVLPLDLVCLMWVLGAVTFSLIETLSLINVSTRFLNAAELDPAEK
jgi:hypothetical protein